MFEDEEHKREQTVENLDIPNLVFFINNGGVGSEMRLRIDVGTGRTIFFGADEETGMSVLLLREGEGVGKLMFLKVEEG